MPAGRVLAWEAMIKDAGKTAAQQLKNRKVSFLYKFRAFVRRIKARQQRLLKIPHYKPIKKTGLNKKGLFNSPKLNRPITLKILYCIAVFNFHLIYK
ncbi:hypothetical protein [Acinetobacter sp.]|uniref:hypothetical protein n=1 Tax=Acinetobacter sp. TaxID=472 RepID=UPI0035ADDEFB